MEWLNLSVTKMATPELRRSTMQERGVWLTLLVYCVQQENGGLIADAAAWNDFECVQVLGVRREDIDGAHMLWKTEGRDIVVSGYPHEKHREVEAKRKAGRKGNRMRWSEAKSCESHSDSQSDTHSESESESGKGKGKRKEREGNRKEKEKENLRGADAPAGQAFGKAQKPKDRSECQAYFVEIGSSPMTADTFFDHFEANGWRQGGRTALRDWKAAARNWWRRDGEFVAGAFGKKRRDGGGAAVPFDPTRPNAHTGGLPIFNDEPVSDGMGGDDMAEPGAAPVAGGQR